MPVENPNLMFEKANDVWVQEHEFFKNICSAPFNAFDLSGKSAKPSFKRTV